MLPIAFAYESLDQLDEAAHRLLTEAATHRIWLFEGEMGAGKTTLIKAVCKQLGVQSAVQSPTFGLVNEYATADGEAVYHFDCYRLKSEVEALDIGIEEYFDSGGYCFVEWPSRIRSLWPPDGLLITLEAEPDGRRTVSLEPV